MFHAANRITEIDDHIRFRINYTYDRNGNRLSTKTNILNNDGSQTDQTRYNQYDARNRATLVSNDSNDASRLGEGAHRIVYDFAGNRISDTYRGSRVIGLAAPDTNPAPGQVPGVFTFFSLENASETTENYHYDAAGRLVSTMMAFYKWISVPTMPPGGCCVPG